MSEKTFVVVLCAALALMFLSYNQGRAAAEAEAERWYRAMSPACKSDMERVAEELKAQDEPTRRRGE